METTVRRPQDDASSSTSSIHSTSSSQTSSTTASTDHPLHKEFDSRATSGLISNNAEAGPSRPRTASPLEPLAIEEPPPPRYPGGVSYTMAGEKLFQQMSEVSEKIRSILPDSNNFRRGSRGIDYAPISTSTPPDSRRSSTNADDIEAGMNGTAPTSLFGFVTSKRRQARQGRWAVFIIAAGGLMYFLINSLIIDDWLRLSGSGSDYEMTNADWIYTSIEDGLKGAGKWMGEGVLPLPVDQSHVLVPINNEPAVELLQPFKRIHAPSLVEYYATGKLPKLPTPDVPNPTVDFVYTFVNASSPILQDAMALKRQQEGLPPSDSGARQHWRDNGELRGAIRSSVQQLGPHLRKVHVLTGDYDFDSPSNDYDTLNSTTANSRLEKVKAAIEQRDAGYEWVEYGDEENEIVGKWRAGQIPTWLDPFAEQDKLQWHFHSEVFRAPADGGELDPRVKKRWHTEAEWQKLATPNFDSFSIEGRLSWLKDLDENFVYSNDDMFLLSPLTATDYHHPFLGPVIRVTGDNNLRIDGNLWGNLKTSAGEWGGLEHASLLLKKRFTPRRRNYMLHLPKALTKTVAHEASVMFAEQMTLAATRSFRVSERGAADIHFSWLTSQLRIERWREALLWTWAVGRLGNEDGMWDVEAQKEVLNVLGIQTAGQEGKEVVFNQQPRETISDMEQVMEEYGWEFPMASNYAWSSMDGLIPQESGSWDVPRKCGFIPSKCFPISLFDQLDGAVQSLKPINATDVFKRLAFEDTACGDCMAMALINRSGSRGLSAILPEADKTYRPTTNRPKQMWDRSEPMLPLVPTWQQGDFRMESVVREGQDKWEGSETLEGQEEGVVRMRDWCVKLLSRYVYTLADSPSHFGMVHNANEMTNTLKHFSDHPDIAMTCINDDQPDSSDGSSVGKILGEWMEKKFGEWDAGWERQGWAWRGPEPESEEE